MIVVDSSAWIDFLNGRNAHHVRRLRARTDEVIVEDLMLCEVLQGPWQRAGGSGNRGRAAPFRNCANGRRRDCGRSGASLRSLRRRGITIRKTIDLLIGTWCIENHTSLLHNDSDFHPMARYLGLIELPVTP